MGLRLDVEAREALRNLPPPMKKRVRAALRMLEHDPFDDQLDLKMLRAHTTPRTWRVRVASYRIVFTVKDGDTWVHRVFHRRDGYGWMDRFDRD